MPKLKAPLLSLDARNSMGKVLTFVRRRGQSIVERKPDVPDSRSPAQLAWRPMFLLARDLWNALSAAEKQVWETTARPHHLTGYMWFMSQALRPNPGIYLPLGGGTMSGAIDMSGFKIEDLPDPTTPQEPVTRQYFEANLPVGGYTEGARVYNDAAQVIPNATDTTLTFNSERYDTDTIHDLVTNPSRLTCRTAGKYIIHIQLDFEISALGIFRYVDMKLNGATKIAWDRKSGGAGTFHLETCTIYDLAEDDYLEVKVYQDSGGELDVHSTPNYSPEFMMQRIG